MGWPTEPGGELQGHISVFLGPLDDLARRTCSLCTSVLDPPAQYLYM